MREPVMCPIETEETSELLLAYCARRLDAETALLLERHMQECSACRSMLAGQQAVWAALDKWEALPVSADFDRRLYARIDAETGPWWRRFFIPLGPWLAHRGIPVAAAACLVMAASLILTRPDTPRPVSSEVRVESVQPDQVERTLQDMELLYSLQRDARGTQEPSAM